MANWGDARADLLATMVTVGNCILLSDKDGWLVSVALSAMASSIFTDTLAATAMRRKDGWNKGFMMGFR